MNSESIETLLYLQSKKEKVEGGCVYIIRLSSILASQSIGIIHSQMLP